MATTPDPAELAVHLLVVSARFTRLAARETPSAIPRAVWRALAQLEELGPTRVSDLAAADRVSQPTATTVVQKLVERGWVERCTDPLYRRAVRVTITDAGRDALKHTREAAADALLPRLARLDPETLRRLTAGIEALSVVLAAEPPAELTRDQRPDSRSDGRPKK